MARLRVVDDRLLLQLNAVEKVLDLRVHSPSVPLTSVREVSVVGASNAFINRRVDTGRPVALPGVMTALSRARYGSGRAAVFVYLGRPAVRVDMRTEPRGWRLFLVSSKHADLDAARVTAAMASPRSEPTTRGQ